MYRVGEEKTGYYASAALALELLRRERWKNVIFAAALAGRQRTLLEIVDARLCRSDVSLPLRRSVDRGKTRIWRNINTGAASIFEPNGKDALQLT